MEGGKHLAAVEVFLLQIGQTKHAYSKFKDDIWHEIYCFADHSHAAAFQSLFGGEVMTDVERRKI